MFPHEQGTGPKNASAVIELILLDHILGCKGEGMKIAVLANTSVGEKWFNVLALSQYFVNEGLVEVVMIVFLQNNPGKLVADICCLRSCRREKKYLDCSGLTSIYTRLLQLR